MRFWPGRAARSSRPDTTCARPTSSPDARVVRPGPDDAAHLSAWGTWGAGEIQGALQAAARGRPQRQFALFAQMLQRWSRLAAVESTRRLALTGLEWELVPGGGAAAEAAAAYCSECLREFETLPAVLAHLALARGYGIAVTELVWERGRLRDLVPVPAARLYAASDEPWRLRVRTGPDGGPALDEDPWKWIVHRPDPQADGLFTGGLLRASALLYLAQNVSFKDWLIYSQVAGMPVRVARFDPGLTETDKRRLLEMLNALGTDAVAAVSKSVELDFFPSGGGSAPYAALQEYCNREVTILWLGQHLTTDIVGEGSRAAAEIHDRVREDLLVHDLAEERRTLERDLLRPLVLQRFGRAALVPHFRRTLVQATDGRTLVETLGVAVRELGLRVPRRWAHQALGIPEAAAGAEVLQMESSR